MNLQDYLLKKGVRCRETAEYLIKNGLVTVNGKAITYPQLPVDGKEKLEILMENYMDAPASFWKIKEIDESVDLIKRGDFVLDVESQDGGFPLYAARKKANVTLVTIRDDLDFLKKEDVYIKKGNIVREDAGKIISSRFDMVFLEIGFDLMKSMQLIEKLRPHIGSRGRLLMFLPLRGRENVREVAENMLFKQKLMVLEFFEARKGIYIYAKAV